jgi:tetratricopeptide (TPR) repeat protein/TolB-like protein
VTRGFFSEFRRRRVLPIAGAYIAIAWLATEIAGFLLEQAGAPGWILRVMAIALVVGFPVTVFIAWVFQREPDGRVVLDSSRGQRKLVVGAVIAGILLTAGLSWLIVPRIEDPPEYPDYAPLPNSVAILPFLDPELTPNEATMGETLYVALTGGLGVVRELTQVNLKLKEDPGDLASFGRRMRVMALLAGRIIHSAGGAQVEMRLLDVRSGKTHWIKRFDWDATRIIEQGSDVINGVLQTMNLPPVSAQQFAGTDNREAYDALLMGERARSRGSGEGILDSIEWFQKAIDLDPAYLRAYILLAMAIESQFNYAKVPRDEEDTLKERQKQALKTAEKLDRDSPDVIAFAGRLHLMEDTPTAIRAFQRALELDPNHQPSLLWYAAAVGYIYPYDQEKSLELWQRLVELDPLDDNYHIELSQALGRVGRDEEAETELQRAIELNPQNPEPYVILAGKLQNQKRYDEAHRLLIKAYMMDPEGIITIGKIARNYARLGAREEALAYLDKVIALNPTGRISFLWAVMVHTELGNGEQADAFAEQFAETYPDDIRVFIVLQEKYIRNNEPQKALELYLETYPDLHQPYELISDVDELWRVIEYAGLLVRVGDEETARPLLRRILERFDEECRPEAAAGGYPCNDAYVAHAYLRDKDKTLAELRRLIVDEQQRMYYRQWYRFDRSPYGELDFLKGDPEYERLMKIVADDFAAQLENVREMERNGEIPPPPP